MPLRVKLRPMDKTRVVRFLTAWECADREAADAVLREVGDDEDPGAVAALIMALAAYCSWLVRHTGPLLDQPPDVDPRDEDAGRGSE